MGKNLRKFRNSIITFAIVSFVSYPLLEIIANLIDTSNGKSTATNGAGVVYFHAISEPAVYLFIFGLMTAVLMSFVYSAICVWTRKHSKVYVAFIAIFGLIVTLCSFMAVTMSIIVLGGLIHESFPL